MFVANLMHAFLPSDIESAGLLGALLVTVLGVGCSITHVRSIVAARLLGWAGVGAAIGAVHALTVDDPAGYRMIGLILALLFAMKSIVSIETYATGVRRIPLAGWIAFATAWPGMRPQPFRGVPGVALRDWIPLVRAGVVRAAVGLGLIAVAAATWTFGSPWLSDSLRRWVATLFLLPGLSLVLHFGLFNMIAGAWRKLGADTYPLFRDPLRATRLQIFWGRRWNLGFSEMTSLAVYRPLRNRLGSAPAQVAAFVFSGLLHELAISVPVQAGYGLPTLYFALHALAMTIESRLAARGTPIDAKPWRGHLWVLAWLALPLPLLFHTSFLNGCVWPLIGM